MWVSTWAKGSGLGSVGWAGKMQVVGIFRDRGIFFGKVITSVMEYF